jgi:hypothetical protein
LKKLDNLLQAPDHLTTALFDVDADLGNELPSESKLSQRKAGDRELADADKTYPELGDIDDVAAELSDGDDPFGNDRDLIGAVLEGDVQQGKAPKIGL